MGDGMLAVFGATAPGQDHVRRAIDAVRRIRAALDTQRAPEVPFEDLGLAPVRGRPQRIRIFTRKS